MKRNQKKTKSGTWIVNVLGSAVFGVILLMATTVMESAYAYSLFKKTGTAAFGTDVQTVAVIYAAIIFGTIVFFAIRNNRTMVWGAVIFEFAMNTILDIKAVLMVEEKQLDYIWIFIAQFIIGAILPIATKSFADELSKMTGKIKKRRRRKRKITEPKTEKS